MLPTKLAFVDIETTGMRSAYDRIIEIGILRVEDNKLVKTFQTLINPQAYLPREITGLTGIRAEDLENAPTFRNVKDEILETLDGCTFVAHNVRFDYAFLKHELLRENFTYNAKHFCTVRLSRLLFPHWPRHNLDAVIQECNISCTNRHRAFDDARVLFDFYTHLRNTLSTEQLEAALAKTLKKPSLPIKLPIEDLDKLPDRPGVYIFYGQNGAPLYVGKSINIKNRVLSHFASDIASPIEMKISQTIESIETIPTAGELGALFLESQMIKEMLPLYNKRSRIKHELIALRCRENKEGYQECFLEPISIITPDILQNFHGFFRSRKQAKAFLTDIAKNFSLCEKLLGLENTKAECFAHRLNRCKGACVAAENAIMYNARLTVALAQVRVLAWPFAGAITIQEDGIDGKSEYFMIDNWCYIGNVTVDSEGNFKDNVVKSVTFDLDMYKILRQYMKNPKNLKRIKSMKQNTSLPNLSGQQATSE